MIIDCDTHFMPRDAFDRVDGHLAHLKPVLKFNKDGAYVGLEFPGKPAEPAGVTPLPPPGSGGTHPGMVDLETRLRDYRTLGIDAHLVLPQFGGWWSSLVDPELASAMAHSLNLAMLRLMREHPSWLHGVALLALQDLDGALREVAWAREQGFKAVVVDRVYPVPEHPFGTPLGIHRELWPLFKQIQDAELPIYLHAVQHGHRMVNLPSYQMFGLDIFAPDDGQMTVASLITSGLLDEYPGLKFIDAERGVGYIQPLIARMEKAWRKATDPVWDEEFERGRRILNPRAPQVVSPELRDERNQHPPRHYFERNFWWTIETEEAALPDAVRDLGADRFLFATDYPHDDPGGRMKWKDVELLAANPGLSESDKERIRWQNAAELFGLQVEP